MAEIEEGSCGGGEKEESGSGLVAAQALGINRKKVIPAIPTFIHRIV